MFLLTLEKSGMEKWGFQSFQSWGQSLLPLSSQIQFLPPLFEQLFLMSSCVLSSMDDHPALLINTCPVND